MSSKRAMEKRSIPNHIGIIMDGNGRWAQERGLGRSQGHLEGLKAAKRIAQASKDLGIKYITLYVFSTENWKRTEDEISFLMVLLKKHLRAEFDFYRKNDIRVIHSGDLIGLPPEVQKEIKDVINDTEKFTSLTINLAINYGGRNEIIRAVERYVSDTSKPPLTESSLIRYFDNPELPDADLIIRTAGEKRLSNFLLWHGAYSELYFSKKFWPDWTEEDLILAIHDYQQRVRRFGGLNE